VDVLRWLSPILRRRMRKTEISGGISALDWLAMGTQKWDDGFPKTGR
jgi:hypothetical protein